MHKGGGLPNKNLKGEGLFGKGIKKREPPALRGAPRYPAKVLSFKLESGFYTGSRFSMATLLSS